MTWVKLDDQFAGHPKIEEAGPAAAWMFVAGLCHCSTYLTDGKITKAASKRLGNVRKPDEQARRLVNAGLWLDCGDHYLVHDYLDYQPSKAKVLAERDAATERKRKSREAKEARSQDGHGVTSPSVTGMSHDPDPTRPIPDPSRPSVVDTNVASLALGVGGQPRDPKVVAALEWMAEDDLQTFIANGGDVMNPTAYRASCLRTRIERDGPDLDRVAAELPYLTSAEMRTELEDRRYLA